MLSGKSGKAELSGSAPVFTVQYLGSCSIGQPAVASDSATTSSQQQQQQQQLFHTEAAVRSLWTDCEAAKRRLRKGYIAVTTEGVKLHLRQCKKSPSAGEENLHTPLCRMPYVCIEMAVDPRLFAWVEHLPQPSGLPDDVRGGGRPAGFQCHAVAFPRAELALRMLGAALHFMSAAYGDLRWARARELRRRAADAGSKPSGVEMRQSEDE